MGLVRGCKLAIGDVAFCAIVYRKAVFPGFCNAAVDCVDGCGTRKLYTHVEAIDIGVSECCGAVMLH